MKKTLLAWLQSNLVGVPVEMIQAHLRALASAPEKAAWRGCIELFNKKRGKKWDWGRTWMLDHLHKWGFSFRVGTTAARKLPPNVDELHDLLIERLAYETRRDLPECTIVVDGKETPLTQIPRVLVVNSDQGGEEVVVAEEQYVPEPKESETDIALMAEDRARCATFAEQVRVRACIGRRGRALLCLV